MEQKMKNNNNNNNNNNGKVKMVYNKTPTSTVNSKNNEISLSNNKKNYLVVKLQRWHWWMWRLRSNYGLMMMNIHEDEIDEHVDYYIKNMNKHNEIRDNDHLNKKKYLPFWLRWNQQTKKFQIHLFINQ